MCTSTATTTNKKKLYKINQKQRDGTDRINFNDLKTAVNRNACCWCCFFFLFFRFSYVSSESNRRCRRPKSFEPLVNGHTRAYTHSTAQHSTRTRYEFSYVSANVIYSHVKYIEMSFNYWMTQQEDDQRRRTFTTIVTTLTASEQ